MAVYLISDVIVHDNDAVEKYRELAADSVLTVIKRARFNLRATWTIRCRDVYRC